MIGKKIIIYPQWKDQEIPDDLYHLRATRLVGKWLKGKAEYNKEIEFNQGIIYFWTDEEYPLTLHVYETKTAIIVRPA